MIRTTARFDNPITSPRGLDDAAVDATNLAAAFVAAAASGTVCRPRGTFRIRFDEDDVWFYWSNYLPRPVYGAVPVVSNLKVDASEATFKLERAAWMVVTGSNQTRLAMFYTPGFTTAQGRYSNIEWTGGTFDFEQASADVAVRSPGFTNAFGFIGADNVTIEKITVKSSSTQVYGRGGFFENCRGVSFRDIFWQNVQQGLYLGFTDDGEASGLRFENMAEGIDWDHVCERWVVSDTRAKTMSQNVFDCGSMRHTVIDGVVADDVANITQVYAKPTAWADYDEYWRHNAYFPVTFDLGADTITFGTPTDFGTVDPDIVDGALIGFRSGSTLPTGLSTQTAYYLINASGSTAQLSLTPGGSAVALSGSPSGTHLCQFYPSDPRYCEKVTVANVVGTNMQFVTDQGGIGQIGLLRTQGNFWMGEALQVIDITFSNWDIAGGCLIGVNEGTVLLENITLRNVQPPRDRYIGYAIVCRQSYYGGGSTGVSRLDLTMRNIKVIGSTEGGIVIFGPTYLDVENIEVQDFTGGTDTDSLGAFDTRYGLVISRAGVKPGSTVRLGGTIQIDGGPDNSTLFSYDDVNTPDPTQPYVLNLFDAKWNLIPDPLATGVTKADIKITNDTARAALPRNLTVAFDETVDTTSTTKTKFAGSDPQVYLKVLAGSVKTLDAIASGSGSNGSTVKLIRRAAGVENDITNGTLRLDPDAGVAADAERHMQMTSNPSNAEIAPGETLVAKIVAAGTGGTSPPCAVNLAVFKFTSV